MRQLAWFLMKLGDMYQKARLKQKHIVKAKNKESSLPFKDKVSGQGKKTTKSAGAIALTKMTNNTSRKWLQSGNFMFHDFFPSCCLVGVPITNGIISCEELKVLWS